MLPWVQDDGVSAWSRASPPQDTLHGFPGPPSAGDSDQGPPLGAPSPRPSATVPLPSPSASAIDSSSSFRELRKLFIRWF